MSDNSDETYLASPAPDTGSASNASSGTSAPKHKEKGTMTAPAKTATAKAAQDKTDFALAPAEKAAAESFEPKAAARQASATRSAVQEPSSETEMAKALPAKCKTRTTAQEMTAATSARPGQKLASAKARLSARRAQAIRANEVPAGGFFASRNDGLGARLQPMLNGLRLARDLGVPFRLWWPKQGDASNPIGDITSLFSRSFIDTHFIDNTEARALGGVAADLQQLLDHSDSDAIVQSVMAGRSYSFDMVGAQIFRLPWEDEASVRSSFRNALRPQDMSAEVASWMVKLKAELSGRASNSVAYHVRHGDVTEFLRTKNRKWPNKFVPSDIYLEHIDHMSANAGGAAIVVFGDNPRSLDWIQRQRPDITLFRDLVDISALRPLQIDFLELYAMSLCGRIVAPSSSGFSQVAVQIGARICVDVMEDLPPERLDAALERITARLEAGARSFLSPGEIGQTAIHADTYLKRTGQGLRSGRMIAGLLDQGVNISFLYPTAMVRLVEAGCTEDALRVAALARTRHLEEIGDFGDVAALKAKVFFGLDQSEAAVSEAAIAFWAAPKSVALEKVFASLLDAGALNGSNFPPVDRILMSYSVRKNSGLDATDDKPVSQGRRYDLFPLICDWHFALRAPYVRHLTQDLLVRWLDRIQGLEKKLLTPEHLPNLTSFRGLLLAHLGRGADAVAEGRNSIAADPENALFHYRLSVSEERNGNLDQALASAEIAITLEPSCAVLHAYKANLLTRAGRTGQAEAAYLMAAALARGLPSISQNASAFMARTKSWENAGSCIDVALAQVPREPKFLSQKGEILRALGRHDEALEIFQTLELEGQGMRFYGAQISNLLADKGNVRAALDYLVVSMHRDPTQVEHRLALARLQRRLKDYDGALATLDPDAVTPFQTSSIEVERSIVFEELGRNAEAVVAAEKAAAAKPGHSWFEKHLGRLRAKQVAAQK